MAHLLHLRLRVKGLALFQGWDISQNISCTCDGSDFTAIGFGVLDLCVRVQRVVDADDGEQGVGFRV